jgi:hypothetical protein
VISVTNLAASEIAHYAKHNVSTLVLALTGVICRNNTNALSDERFFRMRGQKYDYKIKYDDISRLFLLPKPDDVHMAFVIALDKPIRQGQQRYQYLVLQVRHGSVVDLNPRSV